MLLKGRAKENTQCSSKVPSQHAQRSNTQNNALLATEAAADLVIDPIMEATDVQNRHFQAKNTNV